MFRQNASYRVYLNGGRCEKGLGRDELKLCLTSQFNDLLQLVNMVIKYTSRSFFTIKIPHLEGQEVFRSTKRRVDIALGLEGNSHTNYGVNFSQPRVNATSSGFANSNVGVGKSSWIVKDKAFVLTFQGLKVQKHVCGDGVWRIAHRALVFMFANYPI